MKYYIYILFVKMIWQFESDKFDSTTTSLTFVILYILLLLVAAVAHHHSIEIGRIWIWDYSNTIINI
jgi:hypothetical protein